MEITDQIGAYEAYKKRAVMLRNRRVLLAERELVENLRNYCRQHGLRYDLDTGEVEVVQTRDEN